MKLNFCNECAGALTAVNQTDYTCPNGHTFYNNPSSGTAIVFLRGNEVLLARRGIEPRKGQLSFPGGFLEYGEQPEDTVKREAMEETGLAVESCRLLMARTVDYIENVTVVSLVYLVESWNGEFKANDDVASLEWCPIDTIEDDGFAWHYPGLAATLHNI